MYFRVSVKLHLVEKTRYHPIIWICFPPGSQQCSPVHDLKVSISTRSSGRRSSLLRTCLPYCVVFSSGNPCYLFKCLCSKNTGIHQTLHPLLSSSQTPYRSNVNLSNFWLKAADMSGMCHYFRSKYARMELERQHLTSHQAFLTHTYNHSSNVGRNRKTAGAVGFQSNQEVQEEERAEKDLKDTRCPLLTCFYTCIHSHRHTNKSNSLNRQEPVNDTTVTSSCHQY